MTVKDHIRWIATYIHYLSRRCAPDCRGKKLMMLNQNLQMFMKWTQNDVFPVTLAM